MHSIKLRLTPKYKVAFEAIGTQWSIESREKLSSKLITTINERIDVFDATYSRFRKDSLVTKVSEQAGIYAFPADAQKLFAFYAQLYELTGGKVTPLIGSVLENAGYDAEYSFVSKRQKETPRFNEALIINGSIIEAVQPVTIDVGAAGKGYLVDTICALLDDAGITDYVVDASGDLRHKGLIENKVGLEDPREPGKVIGVIDVLDKSICASAVNRRRWGRGLHHIFDPDTKTPTDKIIATWVIADSAVIADGLATALFFSEPVTLRNTFNYEFLRMHSTGAIDYSPAFEGKLF